MSSSTSLMTKLLSSFSFATKSSRLLPSEQKDENFSFLLSIIEGHWRKIDNILSCLEGNSSDSLGPLSCVGEIAGRRNLSGEKWKSFLNITNISWDVEKLRQLNLMSRKQFTDKARGATPRLTIQQFKRFGTCCQLRWSIFSNLLTVKLVFNGYKPHESTLITREEKRHFHDTFYHKICYKRERWQLNVEWMNGELSDGKQIVACCRG